LQRSAKTGTVFNKMDQLHQHNRQLLSGNKIVSLLTCDRYYLLS